ncbi:MAG: UDP-3-O-[3-hydroxymyristoyl] N-acetylglucosamine deacetylase [Elusimicrobia bacterium RIFOXYA2_FULL_53_38]|nr:MAG: UDP-3-O-[3-hydroxymyristoyl] N-acetylglucosamine deacetylase [Elusimicrobia bacterium RIFOXYA2_FULL_53_38]
MRKTLTNNAVMAGIGLHKGRPSVVTFMPAAGPTGIRFFKPDLTGPIQASLENIATTVRGTNLSDGARIIYTVEHVLSACAGLGIDDMDIALEGEEPPAADGSALPFAKALASAGLREKPEQERSLLILEKTVGYSFEEVYYRASPSPSPRFKMTYAHPHPLIGVQTFETTLTPKNYLKEVAPARTFGFKSEIAGLKAAGLALGGSLENAVVIDEDAFLSSEGALRFPNEFARHKLLDLIGDLALTGMALEKVSVEAAYTAHKTNVIFAKLLMNNNH